MLLKYYTIHIPLSPFSVCWRNADNNTVQEALEGLTPHKRGG